ncbi:MAG: 30S ribosomal protein S12 methylthiotransferase RimO [Nitrospinae bacterium]|nr:30S ribosomal protein S12 methylthiotransferase RimO [Nitrospinota bacterium]
MVSLGCPKNRVDSEVILGDVKKNGFEIIAEESKADIIIVNTCGFIDAAREESVDTILRMAGHKKRGACETLVVTGCLSQKYKEDLLREIPEIDLLFGTTQLGLISKILLKKQLDREFAGREGKIWIGDPDAPPENGEGRFLTTSSHSVYLKISEGCSSWCKFCIIPKLRGKYRSRHLESVISEAKSLAQRGAKEINLVSQDTTLYGADLGLKKGLSRLLRGLGKIDGIEWIRLLYCRPSLVDDELVETIASTEKICKYIDIPIQHSHDEMLAAMGRNENEKEIRDLVEKLRQKIPGIAIRTELIVGFPGEKKRHFNHLAEFIEEMEFDRVGVFSYSREDGTEAAAMPNHVCSSLKKERLGQILELQRRISFFKNRKLIGTFHKVLVDGFGYSSEDDGAPDGLPLVEGRLASQAPGGIDGVVYLDRTHAAPGELKDAMIIDAGDYDLIGRCR